MCCLVTLEKLVKMKAIFTSLWKIPWWEIIGRVIHKGLPPEAWDMFCYAKEQKLLLKIY